MSDWPYDANWYRRHTGGPVRAASRQVGRALMDVLHPQYVVDVGCAVGGILDGMLSHRGDRPRVSVGIDHPEAVRLILENDLWLPGMMSPLWGYDLERQGTPLPTASAADFDLAISTEVAEHLTPNAGLHLVLLLTQLADAVAWSAAIPGQGGEHHIEEQPIEYWRRIFESRGFLIDEIDTEGVRALMGKLPEAPWYERLIIYRRSER